MSEGAGRPPAGPLGLLRTRRFAPLFWTQAAAGFNDNLFKQAMALFLAFRASRDAGLDAASLTALAGATFVLPFVLLSAAAGFLADTRDKALLARRLKLAEIALMVLAAAALLDGGAVPLFAVLFLLGCQAALFGPVKYSLLPTHLAPAELVAGNALVEGATFAAILLGSVLGGLLIGTPAGPALVGGGVVLVAVLGYAASRAIPPAPPVAAGPRMGTLAVLRDARADPVLWASILGVSWFWTVGATLLSFVPPLARDVLGGGEAVASTLLGLFSVGIAAGSLACARRLGGTIGAGPVPAAGLAMSVLLVAFAAAVATAGAPAMTGQPWAAALLSPAAIPVVLSLAALSAVCGFFAVPLYAVMQHAAPTGTEARVIGANNIVNALMMVAGAGAVALLSGRLGLSIPVLACLLAGLNAAAALLLRPLARRRFG